MWECSTGVNGNSCKVPTFSGNIMMRSPLFGKRMHRLRRTHEHPLHLLFFSEPRTRRTSRQRDSTCMEHEAETVDFCEAVDQSNCGGGARCPGYASGLFHAPMPAGNAGRFSKASGITAKRCHVTRVAGGASARGGCGCGHDLVYPPFGPGNRTWA